MAHGGWELLDPPGERTKKIANTRCVFALLGTFRPANAVVEFTYSDDSVGWTAIANVGKNASSEVVKNELYSYGFKPGALATVASWTVNLTWSNTK